MKPGMVRARAVVVLCKSKQAGLLLISFAMHYAHLMFLESLYVNNIHLQVSHGFLQLIC